ncbi:zinc finger CCCH-type with G patch domain-containing protein isoform X2 [Helicoverpa zea]|uniref:zinc finger CCCH-type with G patch domain-containing protein isoform X2 n=1 Tax=Helicoverpa zea TaxID=7113 RepID=UPI001F593C03|nr:zinc finger CCCH-type with G patch domain-containing protein isoform X2 [Helicoverpa zea]
MDDLQKSLNEYEEQLAMVNLTLESVNDETEKESLLSLRSDLQQLIELTKENLEAMVPKDKPVEPQTSENKGELDDEYALFMQEMAKSGAYESAKEDKSDSDEEDIEVRVLFTHPTHAEMLPCPFYLDGECKFDDEQCRYSHGALVHLSNLKEAIEPDFSSIKVGSRILMKLKPPDNEDISLVKKSTEKYHLWHRAVIKSIDLDKRTCSVKLEHGVHTGEKRKQGADEYKVKIEEIVPLNNENDEDSDSEDSLSDTEYPQSKAVCENNITDNTKLLVEKSLLNENNTPMGEWERHTRGMGSKMMLAMGYIPGTGLGAASDGRVQPVEARVLPVGKSLDQCMAISEKHAAQDPLKVEQKLRRLQKKEEERNKRAYEREKERERHNVFNFLNRTLGDKTEPDNEPETSLDVKQSSSKVLNVEQFKITEDKKRIEKEIIKLNSSLIKYPSGSNGHRSITLQILEKNKELDSLVQKEKQISKEQSHRKDKEKMTIF